MITLLGVMLFSVISFVSAESLSLLYSDNTEYLLDPVHTHTYDNPDYYVSYVTASLKANADVYVVFNYAGGDQATTDSQRSTSSYNNRKFTNPNPTKVVSSIVLKASTGIFVKDFSVYGYTTLGEWTSELPPTNNGVEGETYCGNNIKEGDEQCDNGELNGQVCTASYGSTCTYCSNSCELKTVKGPYCGDGIVNGGSEKCDDGNTYDGDGCSSECKKPFQITVEDFEPLVWQCNHRFVYDDGTEPGRISKDGQELVERMNDYAFEGEQIQWEVLVMDKNGIDKIRDVYVTVDGYIEANCKRINGVLAQTGADFLETTQVAGRIDPSCNARILEEELTSFDPETMAYYLCTLTIETPESMYGEADINVEVEDQDGIIGMADETEHWFLNPFIELDIDGDFMFDEARPGTMIYSDRILVGNAADYGSGVLLDMFISGTDFYDSSSSGAKCPTTNQLELENFAYYVTNGAYSTHDDPRSDIEGYVPIQYGIGFNDPKPFYNRNEIMQVNKDGNYYRSNVLSPGSEMSVIMRLSLPEPCNGDFDTGQIYFWGEAI